MPSDKPDSKPQSDHPMPADNEVPLKASHGAQVELRGRARDAARGASAVDIAGNTAVRDGIFGGHLDGVAPAEVRDQISPKDGSILEERMNEDGATRDDVLDQGPKKEAAPPTGKQPAVTMPVATVPAKAPEPTPPAKDEPSSDEKKS